MAYPADPVVLEFPAGQVSHVFHGQFWPTSADLGKFWWEAWMMASATAEYWLSEGYGGAHALLVGLTSLGLAGNIWNGTASTSFAGDYLFAEGEWGHDAICWDGTTLYRYINGVPVGKWPFAGPRRAQQGTLFIGGSDHSNFDGGRLAQVRGFEDSLPIQAGLGARAFRPQLPFGAYVDTGAGIVIPSFLATYQHPALTVEDLGQGYDGTRHPGHLVGTATDFALDTLAWYPKPKWVLDTTAPFATDAIVLPAETIPTAPATPQSARIFDSFSRRNQTRAFQLSPTLGSTEAGTLGMLAWTEGEQGGAAAKKWGILQGRAVYLGVGYGVAYVDNGQANMDVRVDRRTAGVGLFNLGLVFRLQDFSNYWSAFTNNTTVTSGSLQLVTVTAGSQANVVAWTLPATSWTTLRIVCSDTTITGYVDNGSGGWTQIGQLTGQTTFQAATKCGLHSYYGDWGLHRWDNFTVL